MGGGRDGGDGRGGRRNVGQFVVGSVTNSTESPACSAADRRRSAAQDDQ